MQDVRFNIKILCGLYCQRTICQNSELNITHLLCCCARLGRTKGAKAVQRQPLFSLEDTSRPPGLHVIHFLCSATNKCTGLDAIVIEKDNVVEICGRHVVLNNHGRDNIKLIGLDKISIQLKKQ